MKKTKCEECVVNDWNEKPQNPIKYTEICKKCIENSNNNYGNNKIFAAILTILFIAFLFLLVVGLIVVLL